MRFKILFKKSKLQGISDDLSIMSFFKAFYFFLCPFAMLISEIKGLVEP